MQKDKIVEDQRDELSAIIEKPDIIEIGGDKYTVYPLTIGKFELLLDNLSTMLPIIKSIDNIAKVNDTKLKAQIGEQIDNIIDAFYIIIQPNSGKPPKRLIRLKSKNLLLRWIEYFRQPAIDSQLQDLKFKMTFLDIKRVLLILKKGSNFADLLKNVSSLKPEENSVG